MPALTAPLRRLNKVVSSAPIYLHYKFYSYLFIILSSCTIWFCLKVFFCACGSCNLYAVVKFSNNNFFFFFSLMFDSCVCGDRWICHYFWQCKMWYRMKKLNKPSLLSIIAWHMLWLFMWNSPHSSFVETISFFTLVRLWLIPSETALCVSYFYIRNQ